MTVVRRLAVLGLTLSLALTGPLAPLAGAQQPTAPVQADRSQEGPKTGSTSLATAFQAPPSMQPEVLKPAESTEGSDSFYSAFAGVATAFLIPGRTATCILGGGAALGVFILTFGSGYRAATRVVEEGCLGKWVVRPEDLRPTRTGVNTPF